jgi:soluble lytic murein transglycosylase-like protein
LRLKGMPGAARLGRVRALGLRRTDVVAILGGVLVATVPMTAAQAGHLVRVASAAPAAAYDVAPPSPRSEAVAAATAPHGWDDLPIALPESPATPLPSPTEAAAIREAPAPVARSQSYKISAAERARVISILEAAAAEFGRNKDLFLKVAFCESSFRQYALGRAGEKGVFQFMPRTFEANARRLGYTLADIWDVRAQARVAAEMMSRGQAWQWTCARKIGAP